ncbi:MAG: hypothetical protein ACI4TD_04315 [Phocaeicola sp.]
MDIIEKAEQRGGGVAPTLEDIIAEAIDDETDSWFEGQGVKAND